MPLSSPVDLSDTDTLTHDTGKTPPDTLTKKHASTGKTNALGHDTVLGIQQQPWKTKMEHDEIANTSPKLKPSQRAKSEAEGLDDWQDLPEEKADLRRNVSTSCSSEINDLSAALESRLSLSKRRSASKTRLRESKLKCWAHIWDDAVYYNGPPRRDNREHYGFTTSGNASGDFRQADGDDNLVQCFVDGCGTTKPFISFLSRHAEQTHSFFYCNDCCKGFRTKEARTAYLPQCSNFCMSPSCVADDAKLSLTGNPQSQRHIRTEECPTVRRVKDKDRLQFLKYVFKSLYPEGTEPVTTIKRKPKVKSISKPNPTASSLRNTTDAKVCKSCRKPEASNGQQKDREARLLNIIRHQISKNGLDPFLESSLLLDAPELLREINEPTEQPDVSRQSDSDVAVMDTGQQMPECGTSRIANGGQGAANDAVAKEVTPRTDTVPALSPSAWAPFMEGFPHEQFEEMVYSLKADGIYPLSPLDAFPGASSDS